MVQPYRSDAQLERWIQETKRNQRRLAIGLAFGTIAAGVAWWFDAFIGKTLVFAVVATAVCGFWITAAHIADWRTQLAARRQHGR